MKNVRIINPPTILTDDSRGPDIGMYSLLARVKESGLPEWLETGEPELVPRDHIPLVWRWNYKEGIATYYARNNVPWIAGQNIFFDDFGRPVPLILPYEYELLHSRSLLGVITDGSDYGDLIQFACRHQIDIMQCPYPPPKEITPQSVDIDFVVYDKLLDRNKSILSSVVEALPGNVEYIVYGGYKQDDWYELIANAATVVYLADNDRYPLAMVEALSAGCDIIGAARCCGPALDFNSGVFAPVKYPYNAGEIAVAASAMQKLTHEVKVSQSEDAREWIDKFPQRFVNAIDTMRKLSQ